MPDCPRLLRRPSGGFTVHDNNDDSPTAEVITLTGFRRKQRTNNQSQDVASLFNDELSQAAEKLPKLKRRNSQLLEEYRERVREDDEGDKTSHPASQESTGDEDGWMPDQVSSSNFVGVTFEVDPVAEPTNGRKRTGSSQKKNGNGRKSTADQNKGRKKRPSRGRGRSRKGQKKTPPS